MRNQKDLCAKYYKRLLSDHKHFVGEACERLASEIRKKCGEILRPIRKVRLMIESIARELARERGD